MGSSISEINLYQLMSPPLLLPGLGLGLPGMRSVKTLRQRLFEWLLPAIVSFQLFAMW
jgi:hypothetical protein